MPKYCLYIVSFFFCISQLGAQDIHFSQFYMSPLNLNPALTGVSNQSQRLILNYRNQWAPALGANAYNTSSFSYDARIPVGYRDYVGIGGTLWGDVAGESNFGTFQARVSGSYSKFLFGKYKTANYLVVGADIGMTQRRISLADLRWPQQHNGIGGFDSTAASGENSLLDPNSAPSVTYPDLSVGVLFFSVQENSSYYGGVGFSHINQPNVSFLSNENASLYTKITLHAGAEYGLNKYYSVLPSFIILMQGPHREYNVGSSLRYKLGGAEFSQEYVQLGFWYRMGNQVNGGLHSDAAIMALRFETGSYGIGFSYDLTTSRFRRAGTANGSFELSMNYYIKGKQRSTVYCPTF